MTRQTNAFNRKWANLEAAYSLWFAFYNLCRAHSALRVTPAVQAVLTHHIWDAEELVALLPEPEAAKRGRYKKRGSEQDCRKYPEGGLYSG